MSNELKLCKARWPRRGPWVFVVSWVVACTVACGNAGSDRRPSSDAAAPDALGVAVPERTRALLALKMPQRKVRAMEIARTLEPREPTDPGLGGFCDELLAARQWEVLEHLETGLADEENADDKLWSLRLTIIGGDRDPECLRMLERMARRRPKVLLLAPYRAGGLEYLLSALDDVEAHVEYRVTSVERLAHFVDASHLPRLEEWASDSTPYDGWFTGQVLPQEEGTPCDTLGAHVREAIERVRSRAEKPAQ